MGKAKVCYYQTRIRNTEPAFQAAVKSQCYWTVEDIIEDRIFDTKEYLLRFESRVMREKFRKAYTSERILPPKSFAARHGGWKDVSYISITKMPSVEEKHRTRKKNMTYEEAAEDILEYLKDQAEWMVTPYSVKRAAIALDSRIKHSS